MPIVGMIDGSKIAIIGGYADDANYLSDVIYLDT